MGKRCGKIVRPCQRLEWILKSRKEKKLSPLICGQILFLQVSTHTNTARAEASKHSRRSDVRAKNLHRKIKASEQSTSNPRRPQRCNSSEQSPWQRLFPAPFHALLWFIGVTRWVTSSTLGTFLHLSCDHCFLRETAPSLKRWCQLPVRD